MRHTSERKERQAPKTEMSRIPFRKSVGFYEVMATSYSGSKSSDTSYTSTSIDKYRSATPPSLMQSQERDSSPKRCVIFKDREAEKEKKEKYLTAKYGQHQMMLIRKRLAVEDWLYDELRSIYNCQEVEDDHDCKLELEEVLNFDTDEEKRKYILETLTDVHQPKEIINKFIEELLQKAKTL